MATNYFKTEERIWFGETPASYWGVYVSGSSYSASCAPWESHEEYDAFHEDVRNWLQDRHVDCYPDRIAGALALYLHGSEQAGDQDWAFELLGDELEDSDVIEQITDAFEQWPSILEVTP